MDKKKNEKWEIVGVYLLFIIGLVGCIFCIFNEINKQKEFENSTDIRSVSAVITQAKEDKESSRIIKYDVNYSYEWCAQGVVPEIGRLQNVNMDIIKW